MSMEVWEFVLTADLILRNIVLDLYGGPARCLMEIVRNAVCAYMLKGKWKPKSAFVEIFLIDDHPVAPGSLSLVVLDHGSGITSANVKLYKKIGRAIEDNQRSHAGAADKRMGRFAAFGYNKRSMKYDIETGFYVFTRTEDSGPVTMISMIPKDFEIHKGAIVERIPGDSPKLGPQKGIKGSFTAVVTPHSFFEDYNQIREAVKWLIPRKKDLMFRFEIGGRAIQPPPLFDEVSVIQDKGPIEAWISRIEDPSDPDGGIWLADAETGFRVASARAIGQKYLPQPLWRSDAVGDIFLPRVLLFQDSSRSGVSNHYLESDEWMSHNAYLMGQVCPKVSALYGDEEAFGRDSASKSLLGLVKEFEDAWGRPEDVAGGDSILFEDIIRKRHTPTQPHPTPTPSKRHGMHLNPRTPKPRALPVRIGNRTFVVSKRLMNPFVWAEVDRLNGQVIYINDGVCEALPTTKEAIRVYQRLMFLWAAGQAESEDPAEIARFVGERCAELKQRKK
jgi:hypothetical protein